MLLLFFKKNVILNELNVSYIQPWSFFFLYIYKYRYNNLKIIIYKKGKKTNMQLIKTKKNGVKICFCQN
jgi:hypothetical protein